MSAGSVIPASAPTAGKPMAATWADVVHGGSVSWLTFVTLVEALLLGSFIVAAIMDPDTSLLNLAMIPVSLIIGIALGGGVAVVAMVVAMPFAWLIARALAHERRIRVHVMAYAALGVVAGLAVVGVNALVFDASSSWETPLPFLATALAAVSAVFGWWRASRTARWALRATS
ncbi:hypothetical protein [Microbacterium sp.]|uniref:hypothetical protein n=1 Tax=Microbacterium sp. TaxID=51671 RepID=UPI0039E3E9E3